MERGLRIPESESLREQPFLREILYGTPKQITGLDLEGNITHNYHDSTGNLYVLSHASQMDDKLLIGSLQMKSISILNLTQIE